MRRAGDVCEGICNRMINLLHFLYYCIYGVLFFVDDGTGPADKSKRTKRVQRWSLPILPDSQTHFFGQSYERAFVFQLSFLFLFCPDMN